MEPSAVAASYDRVAQSEHQLQSEEGADVHRPMFRSFNNFAKKALIATTLERLQHSAVWAPTALDETTGRPGLQLLDLGSGRGGDIPKLLYSNRVGKVWPSAPVVSVMHGFDISPAAVAEAQQRYLQMLAEAKMGVGKFSFHVANCFADDFWPGVDAICAAAPDDSKADGGPPGTALFDVASSQFALHYGCASRATLERLVAGVAARLAPGGAFIGTIVDAAELSARLLADRARPDGAPRDAAVSNALFSVSCDFEKQSPEVAAALEAALRGPPSPPWVLPIGVDYYFTLRGLVDSDEFTVPFATLCEVCAEHGLELEPSASLPLVDHHEGWITCKQKIREFGKEADLSPEEHSLVTLYRSFSFVKR